MTHDVTDLTFASFLSEVGKKTDLTARFSTVVHERGSSETMRDVRGFSVKVSAAMRSARCCGALKWDTPGFIACVARTY